MSGLEAVEPFREDSLATYYYSKNTNKVMLLYKSEINELEASVLIECLAGAIIDISQAQSTAPTTKKEKK